MGRKRRWPKTREERADRNTVVTLIQEVGRRKLRFTVSDLRKHLNDHDRISLHHSHDLSRHVTYLEGPGTLLVQVGARFGSGRDGEAPKGSKRTFVLTSRLAEYHSSPKGDELDDIERVWLALWVASMVCDGPVPTKAVTVVLRHILPLAVEGARQTSTFLQALAQRADPLAEKIKIRGERWVQWKPLGPEPNLDELDEWVREARPALENQSTLSRAGHATKSDVVRELVEIALQAHSSSRWPAGRSVTAADIRAVIHEDDRARYLDRHLRRIGGSLSRVLADVAKTTIVGRTRVNQQVIKVPNPWSEATYLDVPGLPGFESRRLVVPMRGLASLLSSAALHDLNLEYAQALAVGGDEPATAAISAARLLHLQHELDSIGAVLGSTKEQAHLLGTANRDRLDEMSAKYDQLRTLRGTTAGALRRAGEALSPFGIVPEEVLAVDRPLLTGAEYASWFLPSALRGLTPAEFLARAQSLRRYPNPRFVSRADPDPVLRCGTAVDRVEALVYATQRRRTALTGFVATGSALLGRFLRDPRLPALLLDSKDSGLRRQGLAALALLGEEPAYAVGVNALSDPNTGIRPVDAIYALMILQRFTPDLVPTAMRRSADLAVLRTLRDAERAAADGRWLLQR